MTVNTKGLFLLLKEKLFCEKLIIAFSEGELFPLNNKKQFQITTT